MPPVLTKKQKLGLALAVTLLDEKVRRKKRKVWAKRWLMERERFTHVNLVNDYRNFLRMDEQCFVDLLNMVKPYIEKKNTWFRSAVSAVERLVVTLRYLATGRSYEDLKFSSAISPQLLSVIIPETCAAIYHCLKSYIKMPNSEDDWRTLAQQFENKWNFSHALGAMDGKHIAIKKPTGSGSLYFNYKKFFSIVLFAIVNANYEFIYVHAGTNGSISDATILQNTSFYDKLINDRLKVPEPSPLPGTDTIVPYVFLGNSGFGLSTNILKLYPLKNVTHEQRIFNYRLSRARRVVENAFGILSSRFRVFQTTIAINVDNVPLVVFACCALHNYLSQKNARYVTPESVDFEDTVAMQIRPGEWRDTQSLVPLEQSAERHSYEEGNKIRNSFLDYFNDKGAVSFQEDMLSLQQLR